MLDTLVLAGAAAYAIAEARMWRGTLEDRPRLAKKFWRRLCGSREGRMLDGYWKRTWRHNLLYWLRRFSPNFNLGRRKGW